MMRANQLAAAVAAVGLHTERFSAGTVFKRLLVLRQRARFAPVLPLGLAAGVFCLLFAAPARAGLLLHTDAQATMSSGFGFSATYLPIGTVVNGSVDFDVEPGGPWAPTASIASASGTFTWNDGTPRTFHVSSASVTSLSSSGLVTIDFPGNGADHRRANRHGVLDQL